MHDWRSIVHRYRFWSSRWSFYHISLLWSYDERRNQPTSCIEWRWRYECIHFSSWFCGWFNPRFTRRISCLFERSTLSQLRSITLIKFDFLWTAWASNPFFGVVLAFWIECVSTRIQIPYKYCSRKHTSRTIPVTNQMRLLPALWLAWGVGGLVVAAAANGCLLSPWASNLAFDRRSIDLFSNQVLQFQESQSQKRWV